jgi:hypothetical protein
MKKNIIISIMIGGVIGCLLYGYSNLYKENKALNSSMVKLQEDNDKMSTNLSQLITEYSEYQELTIENISNQVIREQELIEPLKKYDKEKYLIQYKNILETYSGCLDQPETIYDYTTDEEFDLLCRIVEAEIGIGDFDQKCNVASSMINRYFSETFPNGWKDLLFQKRNGVYQYSSVGNSSYKEINISEDTILAIEYSFMIEDTTSGCTYFHSGKSSWHKNNLEFVFNDGLHKFYREKGEE